MALSPFQLVNPNMPAASAGQLPDLLGLFGTPPLLNSFTPVQTPLMQMLGGPEPIGSETRPYPLGAFPDNASDQYTSSTLVSNTQQSADIDPGNNSGVQAGPTDLDSTGVTPNAAGLDTSNSAASDSGESSSVGDGSFYSSILCMSKLNLIA